MSLLSLLLVAALAVPAVADRGHESDADSGCVSVRGKWTSAPRIDGCTSPVGMCTEGATRQDLAGDYDFTMATLTSANDRTIPSAFFYTGLSIIHTDDGMLQGTDAGTIDLNPSGPGKFVSLISITDGDSLYAQATGVLQIRGNLDFGTGKARGDYRGQICTP